MDTNNPNMMMQTPPRRSPLGPVIGIIIILVIIIVGSLYFWGQRIDKTMNEYQETTTPTPTETVNTSDEIGDIEADLNATTFTDVDAGVEELQ